MIQIKVDIVNDGEHVLISMDDWEKVVLALQLFGKVEEVYPEPEEDEK